MTAPTTAELLAALKASHCVTVIDEVMAERARQEELWGEQNHPDGTGPLLVLEGFPEWQDSVAGAMHVESWAKRRCDTEHQGGRGTYEMILTEEWAEVIAQDDPENLRVELIQLAAVAVGWAEKIDRDLAAPATVTIPAHHLVGADLGFTCTNCGGHTSLTPPCIPEREVPS